MSGLGLMSLIPEAKDRTADVRKRVNRGSLAFCDGFSTAISDYQTDILNAPVRHSNKKLIYGAEL
jgi:hypothetical protein